VRAPGLLSFIVLLALAAAPAAARTVSDEVDLAPGRTHELNVVADEAATIAWTWRVTPDTATATFDVHTHPSSGGVTVLRGADGSENQGSVSVGPGVYSLFWQDKDDAAFRVTYTAEGEFRLLGEPAPNRARERPDEGKDSPAAGLVAAVAVATASRALRRERARALE